MLVAGAAAQGKIMLLSEIDGGADLAGQVMPRKGCVELLAVHWVSALAGTSFEYLFKHISLCSKRKSLQNWIPPDLPTVVAPRLRTVYLERARLAWPVGKSFPGDPDILKPQRLPVTGAS